MNPLALRIAELCPDVFEIHETHRGGELVRYVTRKGDDDLTEVDPTRDLNACAEFEKGLSQGQWETYGRWLAELNNICFPLHGGYVFQVATATALQRCRAFVATMEGSK